MLNEINGKNVVIHLGVVAGITDAVKGNVVEVSEAWLKIKTNRNLQLVSLSMVRRIEIID